MCVCAWLCKGRRKTRGDPICLFCPPDVSESRLRDLAWGGVKEVGGAMQASTIYIKHNEEVTDIKKFSFEVKGPAVEGGWIVRLAEATEG